MDRGGHRDRAGHTRRSVATARTEGLHYRVGCQESALQTVSAAQRRDEQDVIVAFVPADTPAVPADALDGLVVAAGATT